MGVGAPGRTAHLAPAEDPHPGDRDRRPDRRQSDMIAGVVQRLAPTVMAAPQCGQALGQTIDGVVGIGRESACHPKTVALAPGFF